MFKQFRRMIAIVAAVMLLSTMYSAVSAAATAEKIPDWASAEFAYWQNAGLLQGNEKGELLPGRNVTRAEMAAMLNRIFKFNVHSTERFTDVSDDAWYAEDVSKAAAAGIIKGTGNGQFQPLKSVTRQEAATMAARAFQIALGGEGEIQFIDDAQVASWAREAVYALQAAGYVQGMPDGSYKPLKALTRAEAVKMLHNIMGGLIGDEQTHSYIAGRNLVVNAAGGKLLRAELSGSLYLAPGIGEGDFAIVKSAIAEHVFVNGGGVNSITITDSSIGSLVIDRADGPVRVVVQGASSIGALIVLSEGVELELGEGVDVGAIELYAGEVLINGQLFTPDTIHEFTTEETDPGSEEGTEEGSEEGTDPGTDNGSGSEPGGSNPGGNPGGGTVITPETPKSTQIYTYEQAQSRFANTGAESLVKQYLAFLGDPTYTPALASPDAKMPDLANAITFVNYQYTVKPSIFPSMRDINSSVLNQQRTILWLGTDNGVTKVELSTNKMTPYTVAENQLADNRVLLMIDDGNTGVFVITETGVSHIYQ